MLSVPQTEPLNVMPERPIHLMALSVAFYGLMLALMMAVPLTTIFVPVVLFDCARRNGRNGAFAALSMAGVLLAWLAVVFARTPPIGPHDLALNLAGLLQPFATIGIPALLVLPLVQRNDSFGRVLLIATIAGAAGFGIIELLAWTGAGVSPHAHELDLARDAMAKWPTEKPSWSWAKQSPEALQRVSDVLLYCFEATRIMMVALTFVFSLVLYGRMQAWRDFTESHEVTTPVPFTFRSLALPEWLLFAFVAAGLSPLATGTLRHVGLNVIAVVGFFYLLQGLAIVRWFMTGVGASFLSSFVIYGILLLLTPISELLLSIAGLFDSFFDYRHFNRKDSTHEGHSD